MAFKDPERRRRYNREYGRLRWAGQPPGSRGIHIEVLQPSNLGQTETARGLLGVLAGLIKGVLETKEGDVFIRARTAGYLISIGLKAVEVADLEARLTNLENRVLGGER